MFDSPIPARYIGQKNQTYLFLMFSYHKNYENVKMLDTYIREQKCFSPILLMENKALGLHVCIPKRIQNAIYLEEQRTYYLTLQMKKHYKGESKIYYNLIVTHITDTDDYAIDTIQEDDLDADLDLEDAEDTMNVTVVEPDFTT